MEARSPYESEQRRHRGRAVPWRPRRRWGDLGGRAASEHGLAAVGRLPLSHRLRLGVEMHGRGLALLPPLLGPQATAPVPAAAPCAEHLGPPPPPSLPAAPWWPSGRRGAPRGGILSREEGIFRGRWRELLPPNDSLHAHRILAAVDEPQQFVQRSRCSSLHLGPRAEAGDERDDDAALSPQ